MKKFWVKFFTFMSTLLLLYNNSIMTAHAAILYPGMKLMEDGRIKIEQGYGGTLIATDQNETKWFDWYHGYPYCRYMEAREYVTPSGDVYTTYDKYFDCWLSDYIKVHEESEWPDFLIKGSDGVPFYFSQFAPDLLNYVSNDPKDGIYWCKYCYDEAEGCWVYDKAYRKEFISTWTGTQDIELEDLIAKTKEAIRNGEEINGKAADPVPPELKDKVIDTDNPPSEDPVTPPSEDPVNPPSGEVTDPYEDINTLGATVTLGTDCIKVKKNNAPQKPVPKSVKIGKTALKKNKTFTVSYEKYTDGWNMVDAVTDEGIYRLVVTGANGYEGICTKRLYVTADKTVKAMSSVSVKVNKMPYTGEAITAGVIKHVKVGKRTLVEGTDYTVFYANNTEIGTAQVILTAKEGSGLLGTKTVNFQITGNPMSKAKVSGLRSIAYEPEKDLVQDMSKVMLTYGTDTLKEGTDFEVSYINNTKAGTAKVIFQGKGRYNGNVTKSFKITKAALDENMLDDASKNIKLAYTGKALKPEVKLKCGSTVLKAGTDYTLSYSNNVKMTTDTKPAQITVKGKGNYTGSFKINFTIISDVDNHNGKADAKNVQFVTESAPDDESVADDSEMEAESEIEDSEMEAESEIEDSTIDNGSVADDNTASDHDTVADDNAASEDGTEANDNTESEDGTAADRNAATDDNTVSDKESESEEESILEEVSDNETINEEATDEEVTDEEQSQQTAQTEGEENYLY